MNKTRILVMAGGTGGHVFPALAVAEELRAQGVEVVWLGTRAGLEAEVVPRAGFEIEWVSIGGLRGKGVLTLLLAPFTLVTAVVQSLTIILRRRPMAILGVGGFVTGPGGFVAWLLRKPLLIHEQNAIAGMTNRWLSRVAQRVLEAFPGTFAARRNAIATGNPVRAAISALPLPEPRYAQRNGPLHLLIIGGSLGAQALNEAVPGAVARLSAELRPEVWHQTGKRHLDSAQRHYTQAGVSARVVPFIEDMAEAYGWADLVVCRAGALTISELACAGVGAILVPFPFAVDDHQTANAEYLVRVGAALRVPQSALGVEYLAEILREYCADASTGRARLLAMANAARDLAQPDATRAVAHHCLAAALQG